MSNNSVKQEQPTILYQVPQGTVYANDSPTNSSAVTPLPPLSLDAYQQNSPKLFSAALNGSSSSASSASPANTNDDPNQQLLNSLLFNGGNNMNVQHLVDFLSHFNKDSNGK